MDICHKSQPVLGEYKKEEQTSVGWIYIYIYIWLCIWILTGYGCIHIWMFSSFGYLAVYTTTGCMLCTHLMCNCIWPIRVLKMPDINFGLSLFRV